MEWTMPKAIKQEEWPYYDTKWSWMVCFPKQADVSVRRWLAAEAMCSFATNETALTGSTFLLELRLPREYDMV
jgi:hypothetical protein